MQSYALMLQADDDDRFLTESILQEMQPKIPMQFISTVKQLNHTIAELGPPTVILVNNNNHRHHAINLVRLLKTDPQLDHIPIVVLGEITTPEYVRQFYRAGANTYIIKPSNIAATKKKIETFLDYWFSVAEV
ncbi:hypothetical protein [Terrimonas pollutisoli]|uniref:hypothetical protein n=1 Tax=Terrimonas pollutisoli TaxID=3034147 RepID=UPI0023EB721E|nr:hypothetical protein [Terrimonas sp. H1YJ31]